MSSGIGQTKHNVVQCIEKDKITFGLWCQKNIKPQANDEKTSDKPKMRNCLKNNRPSHLHNFPGHETPGEAEELCFTSLNYAYDSKFMQISDCL